MGYFPAYRLFYEPEYFLANPIEILKTWQGGLASHGGVLGIVICCRLAPSGTRTEVCFGRLTVSASPWALRQMIRLGNLMNHEIYGHATDLPWGSPLHRKRPCVECGTCRTHILRPLASHTDLRGCATSPSSASRDVDVY